MLRGAAHTEGMTDLSAFTALNLDGEEINLGSYAGKVVLVVNTASKCGLSPQFAGLQELHERYGPQGLVVLGFASDQFHQEYSKAEAISAYCEKNFGVSFPMFATIDVNGKNAHPLFVWLKQQQGGLGGSAIKWNFTKFLISRNGEVTDRFSPQTPPERMTARIETLLAQ